MNADNSINRNIDAQTGGGQFRHFALEDAATEGHRSALLEDADTEGHRSASSTEDAGTDGEARGYGIRDIQDAETEGHRVIG